MREASDYVLIGGGLASAAAAQAIRTRDPERSIVIVGEEIHPPYERPPLSSDYLLSDEWTSEKAFLKPDGFYADKRIELRTGVKATAIDRVARTVMLNTGDRVRYEKLLLATGARARRLNGQGRDLAGVFVLRTLSDAEALRRAILQSKRAVMVGAGYIGMEVASACAQRGIETTVVDRNNRPWSGFASPALGGFLREYYEARGVRFLLGDEVATFVGDGQLAAVTTKSGEKIEADLAVVGIGAILNTELAREAGLEVDERHGVKVNAFLQTADPHIWAAGDIAFFEDLALDRQWHVEHFMNAEWQGDAAGAIMAGERKPYNKVAYFFSDLFDIHMCLRGAPSAGTQTVVLGDLPGAEFVELSHDHAGRLQMGVAITRDPSRLDPLADILEGLIRERANVQALSAAAFDL
ncbi:MAG: FAD-dependent oxidoreductase [Ardenticatenaceae bacterium]|nr:FAD-dependent oxidoreductase [Ardenticatenaceae bacterium]